MSLTNWTRSSPLFHFYWLAVILLLHKHIYVFSQHFNIWYTTLYHSLSSGERVVGTCCTSSRHNEKDSSIATCKRNINVGPSSPAQSAHASGGRTCLQSGNWSLRFYRVPHLTPCALLLAWGYTPLPRGWSPETRAKREDKVLCSLKGVGSSPVWTILCFEPTLTSWSRISLFHKDTQSSSESEFIKTS